MGMAPIFQATAITMDTARMYQVMATTMGKADMLLDTGIITDTARFIDKKSGIMGSAHGSILCWGLMESVGTK